MALSTVSTRARRPNTGDATRRKIAPEMAPSRLTSVASSRGPASSSANSAFKPSRISGMGGMRTPLASTAWIRRSSLSATGVIA
jgi:hypothetical protein